jgi:hypothetical protein
VKRRIVVVSSVLALIVLSMIIGGAPSSAAGSPSTAVITFDDAAHVAVLTIPTPACPASQPDCQWKFFLNEPKLSVDVATIYGTSGTLSIAYPKDFCGVIQADAYVGPPWVAKRGFQHTIEDCTTPATTPTTQPSTAAAAATTSTTTTTTTTPPVFGSVAAATAPTPDAPAATPPASAAAATAAAASASAAASPVSAPASAASAQLPFTGRDLKPYLFIGLTLVALGLSLLTTTESWRRMTRRLWPTAHRH